MTDGFHCRTCGQFHPELPMEFGADAPLGYDEMPPEEREARCQLDADLCVIDGQFYFVRGWLEIPVVDGDRPFVWAVWTSLSEPNFLRTCQLWETARRESEPPYFGWLCTSLPFYPDTVSLKALVHTREIGECPFVELEATNHPLAIEQRNGITMDRVREIVEALLHPK